MDHARKVILLSHTPSYQHDPATNLVHWVLELDGTAEHRAAPEPVFRKAVYAGLRLIREIDEARQVKRTAIPMLKSKKRKG